MTGGSDATAPKRPPSWRTRLRWPLRAVVVLGFLELVARQYVARPNRILRHSSDPEMVYENTPGTWLGHAKFDIWTAPIYMVLDLINTGADVKSPAPVGYTIYKIDDDGCRISPDVPGHKLSDVVVLGSSQSFGLFVPQEDTVAAMLQRSLDDRRAPGAPDAQVASCGVIGHHFMQTLRTAERVHETKHPELFAILVRPWHMLEQFDYTEVLNPSNPVMKVVVDHSSLARLIFYVSRREPNQFKKPVVPGPLLEERLDRYARAMSVDGTRTVFYLLDDKTSDSAQFDGLSAMLKQKGFGVERIWTPSKGRDYFVDHDQHWNARGAELTTGEMIDSVARELAGVEAARAAKSAAPP
jgi:hypothetical protein